MLSWFRWFRSNAQHQSCRVVLGVCDPSGLPGFSAGGPSSPGVVVGCRLVQ